MDEYITKQGENVPKPRVLQASFKALVPSLLTMSYNDQRTIIHYWSPHDTYTNKQKTERIKFSLLAVGKLSVLAHSHGFLLDIVLSKETRLSSDHLRNGCWNHHVLNGFIALSWLPALRRDHLVKDTYFF